jgi:hypothetical protein
MEKKTMEPQRIKYIEILQAAISRMNSNSFSIKGWSVTLLSAIIAVAVSLKSIQFVYVAMVPCLLFWILDSIYLQQERKFVVIYREAIKPNTILSDFEINLESEMVKADKKTWYLRVFFSRTMWPFYGMMLAIVILIGPFVARLSGAPTVPYEVNLSVKTPVKSEIMVPDQIKVLGACGVTNKCECCSGNKVKK